jgi:hypothetical protein
MRKTILCGLALAALSVPRTDAAVVKVETEPARASWNYLSWDTEDGTRADRNLLRAGSMIGLRVRVAGQWHNGIDLPSRRTGDEQHGWTYTLDLGHHATLTWIIRAVDGRVETELRGTGDALEQLEIHWPFDPKVAATTLLAGTWDDHGACQLPAVLSAPDFGQMLVTCAESATASIAPALGTPANALPRLRLEGDRAAHSILMVIEIPRDAFARGVKLVLSPVVLDKPAGLRDDLNLWPAVRRGWFNALQSSARWGRAGAGYSAPAGLLANNVLSDPASVSVWFYADQAFWTPTIAPGVSVMPQVRRTVEYWLNARMRPTGEVIGYWEYGNFLDANAGPLIAAWDYVEVTDDRAWLRGQLPRIEKAADFLLSRDVDGDGLIEATQPGTPNTLQQPDRSCAWWDALNCGHKDAYTNALAYRALRCVADLERKLDRPDAAAKYTQQADRLKSNYAKTLFNDQTGWLAWWKDRDGHLHDYAAPTVNGLAIEYGLVDRRHGEQILRRLHAKMKEVGFTRFDLGLPGQLVPVRRSDYLQPDAIGLPSKEDGTDTFGQYMNGGISAGHTLHFLAACYVVGADAIADDILKQMLARQAEGKFQNGVQDAAMKGIDWTDWRGNPTGYEGFLADSFRFLQAIPLREKAMRDRFYRPLEARDARPDAN